MNGQRAISLYTNKSFFGTNIFFPKNYNMWDYMRSLLGGEFVASHCDGNYNARHITFPECFRCCCYGT